MSNIQRNNTSTGEVNLIELINTLLNGKYIIIAFTLIFTLIGGAYAFLATQWWSSTAMITSGQYQDTVSYRKKITNLYAVLDDPSSINNIFNSEKLLKKYISEFNAYDSKQDFIQSSPLMKAYTKGIDLNNVENKSTFINSWIKKINATLSSQSDPNIYLLSFQAKTKDKAYDLLTDYVKFINNKVTNDVVSELKSTISHNIQILQAKKISLELTANQKRANELAITNYAILIAKSARISNPLPNMNGELLFNIDLGSKALIEKSFILKNMKDLSMFEPELGLISMKLNLLDKIKLDTKSNFKSIRFIKSVDYPFNRNKPKRLLIIALSIMTGLIIGTAVVLLGTLFKKEK
ncbi:chain-length determining protein [Photobacterium phosphoreum]|uniref:Chain-length determining protein n=1 Tax=Photobacterium phosphoreum TaxID=659 RepID=A0AAW4ZUN4_PHOPO|nr:Wzz/FepE/Etk N-terminal domain-containing protein [Photobacterium phosphoreum]MCD9490736.1 chain-length determining protein [Photobacterium phosphoreum]MCF2190002.1 chain-length determining protein [Photobacterium phosphoreum]MCF2300789.1 chain-length determining protein [Photobacterium phosphoreum]